MYMCTMYAPILPNKFHSVLNVPINYLSISDSNEDIVKELLDLLVEESGGVDCQLTQNENLQ